MSSDALLSVADVAERVGLKQQAVRRAINRGELSAVKLCGRVRIEPAELAAWIERSRINAAGPPKDRHSSHVKSSTRLRSRLVPR